MRLTNGLSGLLFIGIDIGIAAFFLKKFGKQKPSAYQRPPSGPKRVLSPTHLNFDETMDVTRYPGQSPISGMIR